MRRRWQIREMGMYVSPEAENFGEASSPRARSAHVSSQGVGSSFQMITPLPPLYLPPTECSGNLLSEIDDEEVSDDLLMGGKTCRCSALHCRTDRFHSCSSAAVQAKLETVQ